MTAYKKAQGEVDSVIPSSKLDIAFTPSGRVSGISGCNVFGACCDITGEAIKLESFRISLMLCYQPEGVMEQEASYMRTLRTVTSYTIEGNTLILKNETGEKVAWFQVT